MARIETKLSKNWVIFSLKFSLRISKTIELKWCLLISGNGKVTLKGEYALSRPRSGSNGKDDNNKRT